MPMSSPSGAIRTTLNRHAVGDIPAKERMEHRRRPRHVDHHQGGESRNHEAQHTGGVLPCTGRKLT